MGAVEEGGKVVSKAVEAMQSAPLAIALLMVNLGFIGFNGYVLSKVAENAAERNQTQMALIERLVTECRFVKPSRSPVFLPPPPIDIPITFRPN